MTEKQLLKFVGHEVYIQKHLFPHSVAMESFQGELLSVGTTVIVIRGTTLKTKNHYDFYIDDPRFTKLVLLIWKDIKLITDFKDLGAIKHEEKQDL